MLKRNCFFLSFILFFGVSLYGQRTLNLSGFSKERLERYDDFLTQEVAEGRIPGAVSLVMRRGQIVHQQAYGYSNLAEQTPMQQDQIFHIMSMTKPIVTVAFMMLYEEGHFQLTDRVSKYLPAFKDLEVATDVAAGQESPTEPLDTEITIAHLLTHTAGFSHGLGGTTLDNETAMALYFQAHQSIEDRVNALLEMPLMNQPGERWYYSAAPDVLALLIEQFSGQSVPDFLQERIFTPLGMKDTYYNLPDEKMDRRMLPYKMNDSGQLELDLRAAPMQGHLVFGGTHGLVSTASDYLKFCQMLLQEGKANGQHLLSSKTVELMTLNHLGELEQGPGAGFGLGVGVTTDLAATGALGSEGQYYWSGAYCTYFFIDPEEETIAILMTQVTAYSGYYADKMRQFVYQAMVD